MKVLVVYPFFAHYRTPVLDELRGHGAHTYFLGGDSRRSLGGIRLADLSGDSRFIELPCVHLPAGLMWQRGLLRLALREDFDCFIFLGNAAWPATWLAALIARWRGRRVLFWTHGWLRRERGARAWVRTVFYRIGHGLLLYGHRARQLALERGLPGSRLHVIYNSLDCERQWTLLSALTAQELGSTRERLFGAAQAPVVLAAARLTASKRFDLLIRAAASLIRSGRELRLLFIGDGPERAALERLAREMGVQAAFVGECYDEGELARLFGCASVTASPGNVGLTCMHSLAYGVPVVTHDDPDDQGPEWEAITPETTGSLFRKGSVESLAEALERWTRTPRPDAGTRERCISAIRDRYHPRVQRQLIDRAVAGLPAPPA